MKFIEDLKIKEIERILAAWEANGSDPLINLSICELKFDGQIHQFDEDDTLYQHFAVMICADHANNPENQADILIRDIWWDCDEEDIDCIYTQLPVEAYENGDWLTGNWHAESN